MQNPRIHYKDAKDFFSLPDVSHKHLRLQNISWNLVQLLLQKINKIISPLVVGLFDTNISQCPCLMDGPSSSSDPYTPPSNYQFLHASYKPSNKQNLN